MSSKIAVIHILGLLNQRLNCKMPSVAVCLHHHLLTQQTYETQYLLILSRSIQFAVPDCCSVSAMARLTLFFVCFRQI